MANSAAAITMDIKNQMRSLREKTEQFKARYSPSRGSSPTRSPHSAILEQSILTDSPDVSYQIFEDVKSPNHDRMSGLQESLTENKARLAAILGVGMALDKAYKRSTTPEPHVRFARSTSDADRKDQRMIDQLNTENAQMLEKSKQLSDKMNADFQRVASQLAAKNNNLTVIEAHINAVEALVNSLVSQESGRPSLKPKSPGVVCAQELDADLVSPHSVRFISMISNLSLVKSNQVRMIEDLNNALKTVDDLKSEVRQKQLELTRQQTQNQGNKTDEVKAQLDQALVTNNKLKADHARELEALQLELTLQQAMIHSQGVNADELKIMKTKLDQALSDNHKMQSDHARELESLQAELLEAVSKLNESNAQLIEVYALLGDAESGSERLQEQLQTCGAAREALKKDLEKQQQQQQLQQSKNGSTPVRADATVSALNQAQRELLELKNKIAEYQEELKHSEDIISVQQADIRTLSQKEAAASAALATVQAACIDMEQQRAVHEAALAANATELSDLNTQNAILESRITELSRQLKNTQADLASSQQVNVSRSPEISNKDKLINNLQIALDGNRRELDDVMAQNAQLEANLTEVNKKLQTQSADSSFDSKNSEKLIASLEATLEANKRELNSVLSQNAALENKISELHKQYSNEKRSPMKRVESEESMSLRKELFNKTQEIAELRDRNTELALSNGSYLEKLMQTENELHEEIAGLHDHIAALKTEHESTCEDLRRQVAQLNQQYFSTTARDAEKKVSFTLGGVRSHLKQNGVKFFLWEDMGALLKKVEELHNRPNQPIVCLAELLDFDDEVVEGEEGVTPNSTASGGSGGLQRKTSIPTMKSVLSKKTLLVKGASPGNSAEYSDLSSPSPVAASQPSQSAKTPLSSVKTASRVQMNTESSAARSVTSSNNNESASASRKWNSGKVDKSDPFGDGKNKNPIKAKNSHKEMLERMDSMKVIGNTGASSSGAAKTPTVVGSKKVSSAVTPAKKKAVVGTSVKSVVSGHASDDDETVLTFDEEKDVF